MTRSTPARVAIVEDLLASGRISPALVAEVVVEGRIDDAAWARVQPLHAEQQRERLKQRIEQVEAARATTEGEVLRRIETAIAALLGRTDTYRAANEIIAAASDGLSFSVPAGRHYRIWSELTDRYELGADGEIGATEAMRHAAAEWLTAQHDAAERKNYFRKWLRE